MLMASATGFKRATTSINNKQREASNKSGSVIVKCKRVPRHVSGAGLIFDRLSLIFDHGETDFLPVPAARILQPRNEDLAIGAGNIVMSNAQGTGARSVLSSRHLRDENFGGRMVIDHFDTARTRTHSVHEDCDRAQTSGTAAPKRFWSDTHIF
jgi:hypothetical protein